MTFERIAASWPGVLKRLESISRSSWLMATATQPLAFDVDTAVLTLGFSSPSDVSRFKGSTPGNGPSDHLRTAIEQELGVTVKYRPAPLPPSGGAGGTGPANSGPANSGPAGQGPSGAAAAAPSGVPAPSDTPASSGVPGAGPAAGASATVPGSAATQPGDDAPAAGWANPMSAPDAAGRAPASDPVRTASRPSASAVSDWAVAPIPRTDPTSVPQGLPNTPQPQFPVDDEPAEVEAAASAPQPPVDGTIDTVDAPPLPDEEPPYDDHPPFDDEPPYDPMYDGPPTAPTARTHPTPATPAASAARAQAQPAARAETPAAGRAHAPAQTPTRAAPDGVERRGEAVIRQVLGATFLREEPYQPPTRFN